MQVFDLGVEKVFDRERRHKEQRWSRKPRHFLGARQNLRQTRHPVLGLFGQQAQGRGPRALAKQPRSDSARKYRHLSTLAALALPVFNL